MSFLTNISTKIAVLGRFWQEKGNSSIFRWNLFFIITESLYLAYVFNDLPSQVPIFHSLPWGDSQLGSVTLLFLLPSFSILFLFINNLLAVFYLDNHSLMSKLLIVFSLVFSIFSTISLFQIINLVI